MKLEIQHLEVDYDNDLYKSNYVMYHNKYQKCTKTL